MRGILQNAPRGDNSFMSSGALMAVNPENGTITRVSRPTTTPGCLLTFYGNNAGCVGVHSNFPVVQKLAARGNWYLPTYLVCLQLQAREIISKSPAAEQRWNPMPTDRERSRGWLLRSDEREGMFPAASPATPQCWPDIVGRNR